METKNGNTASPVKPYDDSMWDRFRMYDNLPYQWDSGNEKHLTRISGNVIKAYRCMIKEPYEVKH